MMKLRPYQSDAIACIRRSWETSQSVLLVLPTGCGKTVVMAHLANHLIRDGRRVMLLVHREELIWQAAKTIRTVCGIEADIEMAEYRADRHLYKSPVVLAMVQTLNAGAGNGRVSRFDPHEFSALFIDEAHHATARTYRTVQQHFGTNPDIRILGVTATPDRADEEALGQVFEEVAYNYEICDAIEDGWLVPIATTSVYVHDLDLSGVGTVAGDLNQDQLAAEMEKEPVLHEIASPTIELLGNRRALVFTASVEHAKRLSEIFNRHHSDISRFVTGNTPKDVRRTMFADFAAGRFRILVNVGVATEGFDDPGIELIVMGRPTKSRALYSQMVGRGTRPLPGVVDGLEDKAARRAAIADSAKPRVEILDFVGNSGCHKLVSAVDILGGRYSDQAVAHVAAQIRSGKASANVMDDLARAERWLEEQKRQEAEQAAARAKLIAKARYSTYTVNPFDLFDIRPAKERGWDIGKQISPKMRALLEKHIPDIDVDSLNYAQARQLASELFRRWENNLATPKQIKLLKRYGLPTGISKEQASQWIDRIAANRWKLPHDMEELTEKVEVY